MTPEEKMWNAVISQAFADAFPNDEHWEKNHKQLKNVFAYNHKQANAWFSLGNRDFILTCQNAGVDPEWVMRLYNQRAQKRDRISQGIRGAARRMAMIAVMLLPLAACATQEPAQVGRIMIPDVKACIAEYEPDGFIGTQAEYDAGCYKFASVRFQ